MRQLIIIMALAFSCVTANAQWNKNSGHQTTGQQPQQFSPEAFRKNMEAYIKSHANLTDDEAEKFFPMLAEMQSKQRENTRLISEQMRKGQNAKSDEEYGKILTYIIQLEKANNELTNSYYKKFHTVLSWEKIFKVRTSVERYNMIALSRFSPGRMPGGQPWQWNPGNGQFKMPTPPGQGQK